MIQNNTNLSSPINTHPELLFGNENIFEQVNAPVGDIIKMSDVKNFEKYLKRQELEENTIRAYCFSVRAYLKKYKSINKNNLLAYKANLIEQYRPNTINLRLQGINKYLEYLHKSSLKLKFVKVQQKPFLENVISDADYKILVRHLKKKEHWTFYFLVKYMACTGARISEVVKFKREHVENEKMDIYSKGGKLRRIYIPSKLAKETIVWLDNIHIDEGYIFRNKNDVQISPRGISKMLKEYAAECKCIPLETVYPHSFRHRFALNFIEKYNDLALLSDLLGHSNIQVTQIYVRMTARQQIDIINRTVTWL